MQGRKMNWFGNRCGRWITLGLLVCVTGCQTPNGSSRSWLPWSKPARGGVAQTSVQSDVPAPLRPEQKADLQLALAITAERQGRTEEAKKAYLEIVKIVPKRADVHYRLALLYSRQGECQAAESSFQKAIQLDPENAQLHCDLGYNYYLQRRWPEAEASLGQALALDSSLSRARNNLGLLLARTGREPEAMHQFRMAGCDRAQASANLALAMTLEGRVEHARAEYHRALEFNPNLKAAQDGLANLESLVANRTASHVAPASYRP
ncbi:MAG: tetratricopeptide repeat protein [Pirellulaceae bacterium]|nr:tetratricopeptide repeat protein [Pirellulaceae bacterium]